MADGTVDEGLRAIAHRGRRVMVRSCIARERSAGELATAAGLSRPAASQHLARLVDAGLLRVRSQGRNRWYRADREALQRIGDALADFWQERLATLKREAER